MVKGPPRSNEELMIQRHHMAFSPSRRCFALAMSANIIRIWVIGQSSRVDGQLVHIHHVLELETGHWGLVALDFIDDQTLVCAFSDGVVLAWSIKADEDSALRLHVPLKGGFDRVSSLSLDSHTEAANTMSLLGELGQLNRKSSTSSKAPIGRLRTFSPELDVQQGQGIYAHKLWEWSIPERFSCATSWHEPEHWERLRLAFGAELGQVYVLDLQTGHQPQARRLEQLGCPLSLLRFSPDGALLATSGRRTVFILNVEQGDEKPWRTLEGLGGELLTMSFSPSGRYLACGGIDNGVYYWDLLAKRSLRAISQDHEGWISDLAWSQDERVLASASWDNTVGLFRAGDMAPLYCFDFHKDYVSQVCFVPDTDYLISTSYDRSLCVWDWRQAQLVSQLHGHEDWVHSLYWLGMGLFASASTDRTIRIWSLDELDCAYLLSDERALPIHSARQQAMSASALGELSAPQSEPIYPIHRSSGFGQQRISGNDQALAQHEHAREAIELAQANSLADEVSMIIDDAPEALGALITQVRPAGSSRAVEAPKSKRVSSSRAISAMPEAVSDDALDPPQEMIFLTSLSESSSPRIKPPAQPPVFDRLERRTPHYPMRAPSTQELEDAQEALSPRKITTTETSLPEIRLPSLTSNLMSQSMGQRYEVEIGLVEASLIDHDMSNDGFSAPRLLLDQSDSEVSIQIAQDDGSRFTPQDEWSELSLHLPSLAQESSHPAQVPKVELKTSAPMPPVVEVLDETQEFDAKPSISPAASTVEEIPILLFEAESEADLPLLDASSVEPLVSDILSEHADLEAELLNEIERLDLSVPSISEPSLIDAAHVSVPQTSAEEPLSWSSLVEPSEITPQALHRPVAAALEHAPLPATLNPQHELPPLLEFNFEHETPAAFGVPSDVLSTAEQDKVDRQAQLSSMSEEDESALAPPSTISAPNAPSSDANPVLDFSMSLDSEASSPEVEKEEQPAPPPSTSREGFGTSPFGFKPAFDESEREDRTKEFSRRDLLALFDPVTPEPAQVPVKEVASTLPPPPSAAPASASILRRAPKPSSPEPIDPSLNKEDLLGDVTGLGWMNRPADDVSLFPKLQEPQDGKASPVQEITQDNMPVMSAIIHEERTRPEESLSPHVLSMAQKAQKALSEQARPNATLMFWDHSPAASQAPMPSDLVESFELTVAEIWQMRIAERKAAMKIFKKRGVSQKPFRSWSQLESDHEKITHLSYCSSANVFVVCGSGSFVELWHVRRGRLGSFELPTASSCALLSPDGRALIAGDARGTVHMWLLPAVLEQLAAAPMGKATLRGHKSGVTSLEIDAHGRTLFSASTDGAVRVWDLNDGLCSGVLMHQYGEVLSIAHDGQSAISASSDGMLRFWSEGGTLQGVVGGVGLVSKLAINRKSLLCLTEGGEVHSYQERKHHTSLTFEQRASDLSLSSENLLVVAGEEGHVYVIPELDQEISQTLSTGQRLSAIVVEGSLIVAGTIDGKLELFQRA